LINWFPNTRSYAGARGRGCGCATPPQGGVYRLTIKLNYGGSTNREMFDTQTIHTVRTLKCLIFKLFILW